MNRLPICFRPVHEHYQKENQTLRQADDAVTLFALIFDKVVLDVTWFGSLNTSVAVSNEIPRSRRFLLAFAGSHVNLVSIYYYRIPRRGQVFRFLLRFPSQAKTSPSARSPHIASLRAHGLGLTFRGANSLVNAIDGCGAPSNHRWLASSRHSAAAPHFIELGDPCAQGGLD
jgi:hypothetical protein